MVQFPMMISLYKSVLSNLQGKGHILFLTVFLLFRTSCVHTQDENPFHPSPVPYSNKDTSLSSNNSIIPMSPIQFLQHTSKSDILSLALIFQEFCENVAEDILYVNCSLLHTVCSILTGLSSSPKSFNTRFTLSI